MEVVVQFRVDVVVDVAVGLEGDEAEAHDGRDQRVVSRVARQVERQRRPQPLQPADVQPLQSLGHVGTGLHHRRIHFSLSTPSQQQLLLLLLLMLPQHPGDGEPSAWRHRRRLTVHRLATDGPPGRPNRRQVRRYATDVVFIVVDAAKRNGVAT